MAQKRTSAAAGILALALALAPAPRGTEAAISADEVKALPGWGKALPSKHYSGYLAARNGTRHMHYYLQMSEGNPATDPVTLWMNGTSGAAPASARAARSRGRGSAAARGLFVCQRMPQDTVPIGVARALEAV